MGVKATRTINSIVIVIILTIVALAVLYPLVYTVSSAFSPGNDISNMPLIPFGKGVTFDHFKTLFSGSYVRWFLNTLIIASFTSAGTLLVASMGAYVFSRFRFTFKKSMMMSMLILQIFPSFVGMVAIYVILYRIGGLDTLWGLVLVYLAGNIPYNTWLVKSYMDNIPKSLDEAARIDGANHFRIYGTIILPIAKPILIFLTVTSFTGPWMDYIFPKMVLRSDANMTLALGLFNFVTDRKNEFTNFAAGALLVAIPFVIFFIITQKMLVTSLGGAAVKE
ncbi:MAG: sugar ABC transporter permease [Oscillospiraceae bacterium]|jgi:arabinogalactan oligomer/maltooligosaccharide transport system permease protein|nr:sugar ABC transporter permease [Oscillospiraceae bacterium]